MEFEFATQSGQRIVIRDVESWTEARLLASKKLRCDPFQLSYERLDKGPSWLASKRTKAPLTL